MPQVAKIFCDFLLWFVFRCYDRHHDWTWRQNTSSHYFHLQIATHHLRKPRQELKAGASSRNERRNEHSHSLLLACFSSPYHTTQNHLPVGGTAHSGLRSPASTGNRGDTPHTWPQPNLMEEVLHTHGHSPIWWRKSFTWCCFLSSVSRLVSSSWLKVTTFLYINFIEVFPFRFCIYHHPKLRNMSYKDDVLYFPCGYPAMVLIAYIEENLPVPPLYYQMTQPQTYVHDNSKSGCWFLWKTDGEFD